MIYTKKEAIKVAHEFICELNKLGKKYDMFFNSDTNNAYLSFKTKETGKVWDSISVSWYGDGSGLQVIEEEKIKEKLIEQALAKLTEDERNALGL
jgi:hypothetical protein